MLHEFGSVLLIIAFFFREFILHQIHTKKRQQQQQRNFNESWHVDFCFFLVIRLAHLSSIGFSYVFDY